MPRKTFKDQCSGPNNKTFHNTLKAQFHFLSTLIWLICEYLKAALTQFHRLSELEGMSLNEKVNSRLCWPTHTKCTFSMNEFWLDRNSLNSQKPTRRMAAAHSAKLLYQSTEGRAQMWTVSLSLHAKTPKNLSNALINKKHEQGRTLTWKTSYFSIKCT